MTRRQRILAHIAPAPLPEALIPLLQRATRLTQTRIATLTHLEARMDTLERVTMPHLRRLDESWPYMVAQLQQQAQRLEEWSLRQAVASREAFEKTITKVIRAIARAKVSRRTSR